MTYDSKPLSISSSYALHDHANPSLDPYELIKDLKNQNASLLSSLTQHESGVRKRESRSRHSIIVLLIFAYLFHIATQVDAIDRIYVLVAWVILAVVRIKIHKL